MKIYKKLLLILTVFFLIFNFAEGEKKENLTNTRKADEGKKENFQSKIETIIQIENDEEKIEKTEKLIENSSSFDKNQIRKVYEMYYDLLINNGKYEKLINILPEYFNALNITKDLVKAQVYNEVAFKLATQGKLLDRAVELGEKAFNIVQNHKKNQYDLDVKKWETNINIFLASIEDTLGLVFYKLEEYDKAEKYLTGAIKYLNTASEPHYHLGLVYERRKNYMDAYREFLFAKYLVGTEVEEYEIAVERVEKKAFEDEKSRKDFDKKIKKEVRELKGISENKSK